MRRDSVGPARNDQYMFSKMFNFEFFVIGCKVYLFCFQRHAIENITMEVDYRNISKVNPCSSLASNQ